MVLVFFIWNENISSSQIAQAIWSAFRWQGITKAADMGQIQTCGVQLEKTSCPCFQCPEITSCSPSSSRETGLIVPERNPPLLTEARRQQGCVWGHLCGCSGERETPCLLYSPVTAVTLLCAGLGPAEISLVLPRSRTWGPWVVPVGCWPLHLAASAPRPAHLRCPWVHGRAGFQLHPATSAPPPDSASS